MSEQDGRRLSTRARPTTDDPKAWKAYWRTQEQLWRTEPEIDEERQKYLNERRSITPDIEQGTYPFKDIQLSRADVEWLLATHDNGSGPIDWGNESQQEREGLDLRGAILCRINLRGLPLARLHGSLSRDERIFATLEQCDKATVLLEEANLAGTHLEGADLYRARLQGAILNEAHLARAYLTEAHLENVKFYGAHLEGTQLRLAHLEKTRFVDAHLEATTLESAVLSDEKHIGPRLADVYWSNVNLSVVKWSNIEMLDDERTARRKGKDRERRLKDYESAVRAYRQLSIVLLNQGLNEDAARFAYRAQLMQRLVYRHQRKIGQYLFSLFLDLLAGYGYKAWHSFLAYLIVITAFATTYFIIGRTVGPVLSPLGSFVFSMTAFHGRGFFPGGIGLDDPLTVLAALEAFVGLLIEVTFIATLTRRLFGS
jgi:uncharacterized protein YjbI with pentapeptide repeats